MSKLLFLSGSTREGSLNKKLAKCACELAKSFGAQVTYLDLKMYPLPIYDGDLEVQTGLPANAILLKKIFSEHDGIFIASPEHNSTLSAVLKNTLDWVSRKEQAKETPMLAFKNKVVALGAASPGSLGGLRGLTTLRMILSNLGMMIVPQQVAINNALESFDATDQLKDQTQQSLLLSTIEQFYQMSRALKKN